jgi:hypothetical protein
MSANSTAGGLPRTIWHLTDDADWAKRSLESQTWCITREVANRLRGMAVVLYGMAMTSGPNLRGLGFLASSADDLALCLERAEAVRRQRDDAEFDAEADGERQASKAKAVKAARALPAASKLGRTAARKREPT